MKKLFILVFGVVAALPSQGEVANRKAVEQGAAWAVHVDFDALRRSKIGEFILAEAQTAERKEHLAAAKGMFGVDPLQALHGVTLYSSTGKPEDGVALVHTEMDSERLVGLAEMAEDYQKDSHGAHSIHHWLDNKRQEKEGGEPRTYAAIYKNKIVAFAQKESRLRSALDVLDGKQDSLGESVFPAFGNRTDGLIAQGFAQKLEAPDKGPHAAVFKNAKKAWFQLQQQNEKLSGALRLQADDPEKAAQIASVAEGLIALLNLQAEKTKAKMVAEHLKVEVDGTDAALQIEIPVDDVLALVKGPAKDQGE